MAEKRKRIGGDDGEEKSHKKANRGFQVGPANLPDGPRKRHFDKKKMKLINKANLMEKYAKTKKLFNAQQPQGLVDAVSSTNDGATQANEDEYISLEVAEETIPTAEASTAPHPDRANLIHAEENAVSDSRAAGYSSFPRHKKQKYNTFSRQTSEAQQRKDEVEGKRTARENADRERAAKFEAREKHRKAMAKARTSTGQRKLGRESKPLLEQVKRLVGKS